VPKDKTPAPETHRLRHQAEERLRGNVPAHPCPEAVEDLQRLNHELHVHQIELEMQNEELHRAKDEAEEALARYLDLYEFAPVGYVTLDPKGTILAVNLTGATLLGTERSRLVGLPFQAFLAAGQAPLFGFLDKAFSGQRKQFCEITLKPSGKAELYVRLEAQAANSGKECRVALVDITDLRQEELFHLQVECVEGYAIYLLDKRGTILNWNPGAQRLKGYRAEEIIGRNFSCLYSEKDRANGKPEQELRRAAAEGRFAEECWRIRKDGSGFWADVVLTPLQDEKGQLWGFSKVTHDITDRKKAQEDLSCSEARFHAIFNLAAVGIAQVGLNGQLLLMNQKLSDILGYAFSELETMTLQQISHPDDVAPHLEHISSLLAGAVPSYAMEKRYFCKDGSLIWVNLNVTLVRNQRGEPEYFIAIVEDFNDRKKAEQEIKRLNQSLAERAIELEAANEELEAFNYTVAHDLRQPLNIINSCCQVVERLYGDQLEEECKEHIELAYKTTLRMDRLIGALLSFSRMGRVEPHRENIDLSMLAHEVAGSLKQDEPEREVDFRTAGGMLANADPSLLRVVLSNLLGNAWKYTRLRENPVIEFGVRTVDGVTAYFVRDNGVGFDEGDADKLFAPFQRLPGAEKQKGFGIGLATVERIIRRHGGKVWAEGKPDQGACFFFTLSDS